MAALSGPLEEYQLDYEYTSLRDLVIVLSQGKGETYQLLERVGRRRRPPLGDGPLRGEGWLGRLPRAVLVET